ncbi:hypothetical protein J2X46_003745 [Nocardioides sp. BE266]|uniref:hypothetical protein n=1 Tax=Nocardioides sp. BE266 TaxID=2817725 RepID=UPI00285EA054|nr:hypothetical protein [Nocardioides sp. BE266]MDR7254747.1 hypothetical protein [Nocardioides sp. BE266]
MYDDPWRTPTRDELSLFGSPSPPSLLTGEGRVSHLVFLDGRLVDAWTESHHDSRYEALARELDAERRPRVVHSPPPPPRHEQVLAWLGGIVGGRDALLALAPDPTRPLLREVLDPVADEPWLVVDELLGDVCEELLSPDLEAPLRRCLLLLREKAPWLPERTAPDRIAAGIVWVVGKANAAIGPAGPVTQVSIASHLGVSSLGSNSGAVSGHVRRLGWTSPRPWWAPSPDLYATGRPELLSTTLVEDLVLMRDEALAEQGRLDAVS